MRVLKAALLVLVLPVLALAKEAPPLVVGEVWRSRNSSRVLMVRSSTHVDLRDGSVSAVAPMKIDGKKITVEPTFFGKTMRLEFHRVDGAIVCPDNMKLFPSAELTARDRFGRAKRQLALIGKHLKALETEGKLKYLDGAAFLLQIRNRLTDEELDVFRGVVDDGPTTEKPVAEFRKELRKLALPKGLDNWCSAYAGPNWSCFPVVRAGKHQRRVWACDRCYLGIPPHNGVILLWSDLKVEFVQIRKIRGADPEQGMVMVGPNSPDGRLKKMVYFPR